MNKLLLSFLLLTFTLTSFAQKIVGYIPNYRTTAWMDAHIEWGSMTDAYYFGARVGNAQGTAVTIEQPSRFTHVRNRASQNNLALWLSIGGWGKSEYFSNVAANATARTNFANKLVELCNTYNLTGIDLDWEFPQSYDKANYKLLLKAISDAFDADGSGYLLSVAAGAEQGHVNNWDSGSFQYIDKFNIMSYDDPKLTDGNHSSLKFMKDAMERYKNAGCPYSKMLGGVAFYSRCSSVQMYNQFANAQTFNADLSGGKCYNGSVTNKAKMDWVVSKGGQGVLIWEVTQDVKGQFSLLKDLASNIGPPCTVNKPNFSSSTISICGKNSVTLDPGISPQSGVMYSWKKDGQTINGAVGTTYSATSKGTYEVTAADANCSEKASVTVNGVIDPVDLGSDIALCQTTSEVLSAGSVSGTIKWYKDGVVLNNQTLSSLTVDEDGIYKIQVSATNCQSVIDEVTVTSDLVTADDITICKNNSGMLQINESVSGTVSWYDSPSATTALGTGEQFMVSPNSTKTYYVAAGGSAGSSCTGIDEWKANDTYQRSTAAEVVEVSYQGKKYVMKDGVWWSKNNDPVLYANIWEEAGTCGSASCAKTSAVVTVDACLGSEDITEATDFKVYPNPTSDVVNVSHKKEIVRMDVISSFGTTVLSTKSTSIDVSDLPEGNYVLKITTAEGIDYSKLIKD